MTIKYRKMSNLFVVIVYINMKTRIICNNESSMTYASKTYRTAIIIKGLLTIKKLMAHQVQTNKQSKDDYLNNQEKKAERLLYHASLSC